MTTAAWPALTEPKRRAMLDLLRSGPRDVGEVVGALGISQPTASKHLRVLRDAGLVRVTVVAQRRVYSIDPAPLRALDEWLAPYRALWNGRPDALGQYLDAQES
jgi:DNA-binding transcriptional ArsR family regulator